MNFRKNSKGITLVALVVTIIVLLILAGVSLSLVSGGNGILDKATNAVDETTRGTVEEEAQLFLSEARSDFYQEKYVNGTTNERTFGDYLKSKGTITSSKGTLEIENDASGIYSSNKGGMVEVIINGDGTVAIGEITNGEITIGIKQYAVTYNANGGTGTLAESQKYTKGATVDVDFSSVPVKEGYTFLGWATTESATEPEYSISDTTSFEMSDEAVTLYAVYILNSDLSWTISYKSEEQTFEVPYSGLYSVKVYGASGGKGGSYYGDRK